MVEDVVEVGQGPAVASGLPPNVEIELASRQSMISARATTPAMAKPLPKPLAKVRRSGVIP